MIIGKLDRRIRVEQRTVTQNATGEADEAWATLFETWAERRDMRGREAIAARQTDFDGETMWRIRWRADVSHDATRLVDLEDDQIHDIVSVALIGRREGLELVTRRAP